MNRDKVRGALLGTAVGDALGMPVEGFSHQNVRTYYKGIKKYRADERRGDLQAGQWTDDTQFTFALVRALTETDLPSAFAQWAAVAYVELLPEARRWGGSSRPAVERLADGAAPSEAGVEQRPGNGAAMRAAPLGVWWAASGASREEAFQVVRSVLEVTHAHPAALAAGFGQAYAVQQALLNRPDTFDPAAFWDGLVEITAWFEEQGDPADRSCSDRLRRLTGHLGDYPLDLQDLCDGTGSAADESWPFAVAMFARNPRLNEATLLAAINVGGDADTIGAMTGALLGALHGWSAFPAEWRDGLEDAHRLQREADALYERLMG